MLTQSELSERGRKIRVWSQRYTNERFYLPKNNAHKKIVKNSSSYNVFVYTLWRRTFSMYLWRLSESASLIVPLTQCPFSPNTCSSLSVAAVRGHSWMLYWTEEKWDVCEWVRVWEFILPLVYHCPAHISNINLECLIYGSLYLLCAYNYKIWTPSLKPCNNTGELHTNVGSFTYRRHLNWLLYTVNCTSKVWLTHIVCFLISEQPKSQSSMFSSCSAPSSRVYTPSQLLWFN